MQASVIVRSSSQLCNYPEALRISLIAVNVNPIQTSTELGFGYMPKRRMSEIVGERRRLSCIDVYAIDFTEQSLV